jgi:hypothetical protein
MSSDPDLALYQEAFAAYLDALAPLRPTGDRPLPYDLVDAVGTVNWHMPVLDTLIAGDVRESLNEIHQWQSQLVSLRAWVKVVTSGKFGQDDAWTLRRDWVEPVATWCLLQPAATRDRLGNLATNVVHHGRVSTDATYEDRLAGDDNNRFLNRPERERQLRRIGQMTPALRAFINRLSALDDKAFRAQTFDFRNRASHSIAPRLEEGFTQMVKRRVGPSQALVMQPDGRYRMVPDTSRRVVSYGFGGTPPLALDVATELVAGEYKKARLAVAAYLDLVRDTIKGMASR